MKRATYLYGSASRIVRFKKFFISRFMFWDKDLCGLYCVNVRFRTELCSLNYGVIVHDLGCQIKFDKMMMVFIVPVRSKTITSDWITFSNLVNRCIGSICNQTNTNYKVLVPCHEIPETKFNNDARVQFLKVDFSPPILKNKPEDRWLKEADKGMKIKLAAEYAKKIEASYLMTVDSDDCISNKVCEFVIKNGTDLIPGWFVKKGYLYPEGKRYSYLNTKNFHTVCGSCVIIKPELIDLMYGKNHWFDHERTSFSNGISLKALPFPGALYSMLNGTNIRLDSKEMQKRTKFNMFDLSSIKTLFRRLAKYRLVPNIFISKEFAIYND